MNIVSVLARVEELEERMDTLEKSESSKVMDEDGNIHSRQRALEDRVQSLELKLALCKKALVNLDWEVPMKEVLC